MKKYFKALFAFILLLVPVMVNAKEITTAKAPEYISEKDILVANGTPVVIEEKSGSTYVTWEGGEQLVTANTTVIGGYYNPYVDENVTLDLSSTSVTMNSGKIAYIVGGNIVDKNYANYDKIHVGTINIKINGGELKEVSAVSMATNVANVALTADYYSKIESYYYADRVNISVSKATISERLYILSSYTYAKDVEVNISNGAVLHDGYYALAVGTNGKVDNFVINIADSKVDQIHSGFRAMVNYMEVNITGNSTIGDIYAGSEYAKAEQAGPNGWNGWKLGDINYGQVGSMIFNIDSDVTYNNIYAGFQFVDKEIFETTFAGNAALNTYAKGIEGSENAKVVINIANAPKVTDSGLTSMIDGYKKENVTVNYTPSSSVPVVFPGADVSEPQFGVTEGDKVDAILGESASNNEKVLDAVANGSNVTTTLDITEVTKPSDELVEKFEAALADSKINATIVNYVDINVLVESNGTTLTTISELVKPITLTVTLPEDLQAVKEGYVRTYYILREHNGEVDILEATLNKDGNAVSFETDKFSTYALTYVDSLASTPSEPVETPDVPQTFDNSAIYLTLATVSAIGLAASVLYLKRRNA